MILKHRNCGGTVETINQENDLDYKYVCQVCNEEVDLLEDTLIIDTDYDTEFDRKTE